jgi:hypothetical protein
MNSTQKIEAELLCEEMELKQSEVLFITTADGKLFPIELKVWLGEEEL